MILLRGDKIKMIKPMDGFEHVNSIFEVTDILHNGIICFAHNTHGTGLFTYEEFEKYFVKTKWSEWFVSSSISFQ